jgi:NAD(P)-dependent dehydrogenase (short-subunit alcohol dehydrogenase family)
MNRLPEVPVQGLSGRQEVGNMEVAIVTGASKGLGRALAEGLAEGGWSLVIDARTEAALESTGRALGARLWPGARVLAVPGDITSPSHRSELVKAAGQLGRLDLIVNNASSLGETPLPKLRDYDLESLRDVFEVNVVAPLALLQQALGLLEQSPDPRLLNITSDASLEHYEGWGGYGLTKAALDHASITFGVESPGIRSWSVDPGDLRTDMHQQAFPGEDISDRPLPESVIPNLMAVINSQLPSGRYKASETATTSDIAVSAGTVK